VVEGGHGYHITAVAPQVKPWELLGKVAYIKARVSEKIVLPLASLDAGRGWHEPPSEAPLSLWAVHI